MSGVAVLVVEDNEKNLKLARDVLEHAGFTVHVASTGEIGVDLARSVRPDVILMDLQLPGIDGLAALARLRRDPSTAPIPVVALTAFAMRQDRERTLAAGFDGYLQKPINVRSFPDQVRPTCERATHDRARPRVLVVDDLAQNLKLLDAVLSPRGFEVLTVDSGEAALEFLATACPT